ncbi:unnamed protein product [Penicillium salamii]|nr:unnamed protein product [Penicillium salamii]CAG8076663.1 unnamed protein product [Penicillium salamii]
MDHPTSPSPIDWPAKRQCRVSQAPEDEPKLKNQPQQVTNSTTIEPKRQLQASNDLLASDSDILLQLCNVQASVLWERKRAVQALCNGVVSALEASDLQACSAKEPEGW